MSFDDSFTQELITQFAIRRNQLGLTQRHVDDRIGVASGLVAKWESGNRKPTLFNAHCWAEALGCHVKLEAYNDDLRY
jgi:transcriptional regulator with XRE-family HTH domain|tara:strand:- start:1540 stop:1773 length:234 start_codon:yes stop_codon:yes gene_type:complete